VQSVKHLIVSHPQDKGQLSAEAFKASKEQLPIEHLRKIHSFFAD
jgi:hypothetical protein